jgi:hypothetical protein
MTTTTQNIEDLLMAALDTEDVAEMISDFDATSVKSACSFSNAGILTSNNGVVIRFADGSEFQITIVKVK